MATWPVGICIPKPPPHDADRSHHVPYRCALKERPRPAFAFAAGRAGACAGVRVRGDRLPAPPRRRRSGTHFQVPRSLLLSRGADDVEASGPAEAERLNELTSTPALPQNSKKRRFPKALCKKTSVSRVASMPSSSISLKMLSAEAVCRGLAREQARRSCSYSKALGFKPRRSIWSTQAAADFTSPCWAWPRRMVAKERVSGRSFASRIVEKRAVARSMSPARTCASMSAVYMTTSA
mmetsp:Transcript_11920/g.25165  ORF Transcript_11920/g.25165 Transcript_11920/m.25165 type:complete len:237 (-) Transcript_11920:1716-2426(-)